MLVADAAADAGQEDTWKDAEVDTVLFLVREAVFGRQLDIAKPGAPCLVIGQWQYGGQLQVGRAAIVEVDAVSPAMPPCDWTPLEMAQISKCL